MGEGGGGGTRRFPPGDASGKLERHRLLRPQPVHHRRAESGPFLRRRTSVEGARTPSRARDRRIGTPSRLRRQRPPGSHDGERGARLPRPLRGAPRAAGGGGHQQQLDLLRRAGAGRDGARNSGPRRHPRAASPCARAGPRVPRHRSVPRQRRGPRPRCPRSAGSRSRVARPPPGRTPHRLRPRALFRRLGSARPSPLSVGGTSLLPAASRLFRAGRDHHAATKRRCRKRCLRAARLSPGGLGGGCGSMAGPRPRRPRSGAARLFRRGAARD